MSGSYMLSVAEHFSKNHLVILPDQRGTGESEKPPVSKDNYQLEKYVQDLLALQCHLEIERWDVVGHSWGGTLAMAFACHKPQSVSRLGLIGTCGPNTRFLTPALEELRSRLTQPDLKLLALSNDPDLLRKDPAAAARAGNQGFMPAFFYDREAGERYRDEHLDLEGTQGVFGAVFGKMREDGTDLLPCLSTFDQPALVIHGDHDHIPVEYAEEVADALPCCRFVLLPNCGHFPWAEAEELLYRNLDLFLGEPVS